MKADTIQMQLNTVQQHQYKLPFTVLDKLHAILLLKSSFGFREICIYISRARYITYCTECHHASLSVIG